MEAKFQVLAYLCRKARKILEMRSQLKNTENDLFKKIIFCFVFHIGFIIYFNAANVFKVNI